MYEVHSMNKLKYCLRSWKQKIMFTVGPFSRKSFVMGPLMSYKTISITFFDGFCTQNFFFTRESVHFHSIDYLFDSGA